MLSKLFTWLRKDGAALFGLILALVRVIREIIVTIIRILAIFLPDSFVEDTLILKISNIGDTAEKALKKITDFLLSRIG